MLLSLVCLAVRHEQEAAEGNRPTIERTKARAPGDSACFPFGQLRYVSRDPQI